MASAEPTALLVRAEEARASGDLPGTRRHLVAAFRAARDAGDVPVLVAAALELPSLQGFGTHPGQVPAYLHEALLAATDDRDRARLSAALARAWVYGGETARAAAYARAAQELAATLDDPVTTAEALDAALLAAWGPDDFTERVRLAARIEEVGSHLVDPELRLTAHVWRLTTAWECLDVLAVQRQLRALDLLAEESGLPRVGFYAASRRAMHALVVGDLAGAARLRARTEELGRGLAEADVRAVLFSLHAEEARLSGDLGTLSALAPAFAEFGLAEGVPSILAQGAVYALECGESGRAAELLDLLPPLAQLPEDMDTLLTLGCAAYVGVGVARHEVAAEAAGLLEPYAGRAVLNAGAVTFHGVVDDYLARVGAALGQGRTRGWLASAHAAYRRLGATPWAARLPAEPERAVRVDRVLHLRPDGDHWVVGPEGVTSWLPDLRGLHHLQQLLARPGVDVAATDLSGLAAGHAGAAPREADLGPVLDATAKRAYRQRLSDLDTEIDEAQAWSDEGRLAAAVAEREALLQELSRAVGLGGRDRRPGGTSERARTAVRKSIAAALTRIEQHDAATARLLRDAVRTGATCRYEPDPGRPVRWVLTTGEDVTPSRPRP